jgi:hypothetical protein
MFSGYNQVTSCLNKHKKLCSTSRISVSHFINVAIADWDHRDLLAGDRIQQDIFRWLSPPDPWKNHHVACGSRHGGSAAWFIQSKTFSEWKASMARSSLLWVHGKRPLMPSSYTFAETENFPSRSGRGKKRSLVCQTFDGSVSRTYRVGQLHNHQRR